MSENILKLNELINESENRLNSLKPSVDNRYEINRLCQSLAVLYNNRGFLYYKSVEFNLAADDYTKAIQLDTSLAIAFYNRATIHYRMDHFDKAFNDLKIAIDLDPNNSEFRLAFDQTSDQLNKNLIQIKC